MGAAGGATAVITLSFRRASAETTALSHGWGVLTAEGTAGTTIRW